MFSQGRLQLLNQMLLSYHLKLKLATASASISLPNERKNRRHQVVMWYSQLVRCFRAELRTSRRLDLSGAVVRVSLETYCFEQCVTRVPRVDGNVTGVQLLQKTLSNTPDIALTIFNDSRTDSHRHSVRLLTRESNAYTWSVTYETELDFSERSIYSNSICVSCGFLLCAAHWYSRRLVALEVTRDSKLRPAGAFEFDSEINGLCEFKSGGEQLVATTHEDSTLRVWRHQLQAAAETDIELVECCRVTTGNFVCNIVSAYAGLLVASNGTGPMRLCIVTGSHVEAPVPQPQLGNAGIKCWCRAHDEIVAYDRNTKSLLLLSSDKTALAF